MTRDIPLPVVWSASLDTGCLEREKITSEIKGITAVENTPFCSGLCTSAQTQMDSTSISCYTMTNRLPCPLYIFVYIHHKTVA